MYSVGFGFILGLIYDFFRILRILIIKNSKAVPVQDIVYFLLCAMLTFVFLLVINNGRFRLNIFVALVSGFTVYYLTLGKFSVDFVVSIVRKIISIINTIARVITAPYLFVLALFRKTYHKLPENFKNIEFSRKKAEKTLENEE